MVSSMKPGERDKYRQQQKEFGSLGAPGKVIDALVQWFLTSSMGTT